MSIQSLRKKMRASLFPRADLMARFYITTALAVMLTGCACFAPQQASQTDLKTIAKSEKTFPTKRKEKEDSRRRRNANAYTKIAKRITTARMENPPQLGDKPNASLEKSVSTKIETPSLQPDDKYNVATKIETSQSAQQHDKSSGETNIKSIAAKAEVSQSTQPDDMTKKAKIAVAEKMDNPTAVVFLDMRRAARKDALGNSVDTICGQVVGELAGKAGERPFLYIVQKDEAYVGAMMATTAYRYRNICN
jgi:hypothetical protein